MLRSRLRASGEHRAGAVCRVTLAVLCGLTSAAFGFGREPSPHPRLVTVDAAQCTVCHDDLLDKPVVHAAAADDCTTCHEFSASEDGARVALAVAEPALCVMCHDDLESAVEGTLEVPHAPVTGSCLTCHDPHAAEAARLLLGPASELCATCHDTTEIAEPHGGQLTASTDCARCHEPHGSDTNRMLTGLHRHAPFSDGSCEACHRAPFGNRTRLRARGERLCEACHGDVAGPARKNGTVHAAMTGTKGRAGCLSCHDPHMSPNRVLLRDDPTDLCGRCHEKVVEAASVETGHYPAAEDCTTCHLPHASPEPALLSAPRSELCRDCHEAGDEHLVRVHLGADLATLDCTSCHTPHGSGHDKLLAVNLHPPVVEGCDTCHEGSSEELADDGESALCLMCHDDIDDAIRQAAVPHAAMEIARCADCHNPHASPQDRLVKMPGGGVCVECHDEQAPGDDEVAHGVIELIGCQACHEPHGGGEAKLLRGKGSELCLACHDPQRLAMRDERTPVRVMGRFEVSQEAARAMARLRLSPDGKQGHPVVGHRVLGTPTADEIENTQSTFEGELTCLTCHDPHKGRSADLLQWNARSPMEACLHCHPK